MSFNKNNFEDWAVFDRLTKPCIENKCGLQTNTQIENTCDHCRSTQFIYEDGLCCCTQCGAVADDIMFHSKEQSFASDTTRQMVRVGMPTNPLLPTSSLGSVISSKGKRTPAMKKMCQYHQWNSMPYRERSLWTVYNKIMNKAKRGGISNLLINEAKSIYKSLSEVSISRGSNRNGLIAACVYVSCKRNNVPRSVKEIAQMFDLTVPELTKGAKKLHEIMNMCHKQIHHTNSIVNLSTTVKTTGAADFIDRFCSSLNVGPDIIKLCTTVANSATDIGIVDENTPPSVASGCIFLVTQTIPSLRNKITKKNISEACNISEVTIGKCFKKLFPYRSYLFTKEDVLNFGVII
tara:strand:- start:1082 stop:2128 length:1047 start_codon:yes stop_codon:yes gene_type:complete